MKEEYGMIALGARRILNATPTIWLAEGPAVLVLLRPLTSAA